MEKTTGEDLAPCYQLCRFVGEADRPAELPYLDDSRKTSQPTLAAFAYARPSSQRLLSYY